MSRSRIRGLSSLAWMALGIIICSTQEPLRLAADERPSTGQFKSNSFLDTLWLVQHVGKSTVVEPRYDAKTKSIIARSLANGSVLPASSGIDLLGQSTFDRLAAPDGLLNVHKIQQALTTQIPESRKRLFPELAEHLALLTTEYDQIDEAHAIAGSQLVAWIVKNYRPGQPLAITCVCTGNSRRSILGATFVSLAADYYGLPEIRGYSGGTHPSAFNERTITTLREIGCEISPLQIGLRDGEQPTSNPRYRIRWGGSPHDSTSQSIEFSKRYDDPGNPTTNFAALMVCSEADLECPTVNGATLRIAIPYLDPKLFDGSSAEGRNYAERRDDIGRLMLAVMMQSRLQLRAAGRLTAEEHPEK